MRIAFATDGIFPHALGGIQRHTALLAAELARAGDDVEVLARVDVGEHRSVPVMCRSGAVLVSSFHPELTDDLRIHQLFMDLVAG